MIKLKDKVIIGTQKKPRIVAGMAYYIKDGETRLGYFINDSANVDQADFIDESRVKEYSGSKKK